MYIRIGLGIRHIHRIARRIWVLGGAVQVRNYPSTKVVRGIIRAAFVEGMYKLIKVKSWCINVGRCLAGTFSSMRIRGPVPQNLNTLLENDIPGINPGLLPHLQKVSA